jgi:geranylgeranyl transferase type-2 subunit alpha
VIKALEDLADDDQQTMTQAVIDYTTKMVKSNLSNFSAWHYRTKAIQKLLEEKNAGAEERREVLDQGRAKITSLPSALTETDLWSTELELSQRALIDPYDQSLWFYHQNLMCVFDPSLAQRTFAPNLSASERLEYVQEEKDLITEMLEDYTDCKWIYQALVDCNRIAAKITGTMSGEDRAEILRWLKCLNELDPLRSGHWADIENEVMR